jgi:hypothetical protein
MVVSVTMCLDAVNCFTGPAKARDLADQHLSEELEWRTRRNRIDPKLRGLDWKIVPFKSDLELFGVPAARDN